MQLWDKMARDRRLILVLLSTVTILSVVSVSLSVAVVQSNKQHILYLPPSLESGATIKTNIVPDENVYGFAHYVWQLVNHWHQDGEEDFKYNLEAYGPYLTPEFQKILAKQFETAINRGEVKSRKRVMQPVHVGGAYDADNVVKLADGSWIVSLLFRVTEYNGSSVVKDVDIKYPIHVVRYDINREMNHWGLALAGFSEEPQRIRTHFTQRQGLV